MNVFQALTKMGYRTDKFFHWTTGIPGGGDWPRTEFEAYKFYQCVKYNMNTLAYEQSYNALFQYAPSYSQALLSKAAQQRSVTGVLQILGLSNRRSQGLPTNWPGNEDEDLAFWGWYSEAFGDETASIILNSGPSWIEGQPRNLNYRIKRCAARGCDYIVEYYVGAANIPNYCSDHQLVGTCCKCGEPTPPYDPDKKPPKFCDVCFKKRETTKTTILCKWCKKLVPNYEGEKQHDYCQECDTLLQKKCAVRGCQFSVYYKVYWNNPPQFCEQHNRSV